MPHALLTLTLIPILLCCGVVRAEQPSSPSRVDASLDWPSFLARHDLVWTEMPTTWRGGAFLGNGLMGSMIYAEEQAPLRLDVGRSDVVDQRKHRHGVLIDNARLPIGNFALQPVGAVTAGTMRLDLWNAEARGTLTTDAGAIDWRAYVHADRQVIVVETQATAGEADFQWRWMPAVSESPRIFGKGRPKDYQSNPAPTVETNRDGGTCLQPLLEGGEYATAWRETRPAPGQRTLYVSVGYSWPEANATAEVQETLSAAAAVKPESLLESHRQWWQAFYPASFLSIPDGRLESFYWIQMYKLGAASRSDRPALDLMGPWYKKSIWPAFWWNLNTQLTYSPVYTANRLELGENLCQMFDDNLEHLVANAAHRKFKGATGNAPAALLARATSYRLAGGMFKGQQGHPEIGNLTWACHNYWRQCRYAADHQRMREKMLPLLKLAVNYYLNILTQDDAGRYHLPTTYSPEIGFSADLNYDLALLRWGCQTLVAEHERQNLDDPLLPKWKDVLQNLTPLPADENGLRLGADAPYERSHRHYSHLLAIYPLYVLNQDQPEHRALVEKSIRHWAGMKGAFAGYSYSGAASMFASIGSGDEATPFLHEFMQRQLQPNTMYLEADSPVIESPLSAAQSIHDLLLQSWTNAEFRQGKLEHRSTLRIFPAVPTAWQEVAFHNLRGEGAFLVSALRQQGRTVWERVESLAGEPCHIRTSLTGPVRATQPIAAVKDGVYTFNLRPGQAVLLYSGDQPPPLTIQPVATAPAAHNHFGSAAELTKRRK